MFNEISNRFAITSGGIGEALQRSASSMSAANNTMEETVALATAMNTIVQNPESVGTSLRSLSMFLRAAKTEASEAGEDVSTMANSVSELRQQILDLTGQRVDIMISDTEFKSTFQILKELSEVWDDLTDVTQSNILNLIAGKRQSNSAAALLQSFEIAEQALAAAHESAGSAARENEKFLDSIQGKINQFKASFEALSSSVVNSDFIKHLIDGATSLISLFDAITQKIGPLPGLLMGITSLLNVSGFGRHSSTCLSNMPKYTLMVTWNELAA